MKPETNFTNELQPIETTRKIEGTHRVRTRAILLLTALLL